MSSATILHTKLIAPSLVAVLALACTTTPGAEGAETGGTDDTDETGETGETGSVCQWPVDDPAADAVPQTITFVNDTNTTRFLYAGSCDPSLLLFEDGVGDSCDDDTETPCAELMTMPEHESCGDPCSDWDIVDAIRVEPGASYSYEWDGHLWAYEQVDSICLDEIGACFNGCNRGLVPEPGDELFVQFMSAECNPEYTDDCACDPVDGVCTLAAPLDSSLLFHDTRVFHEAMLVVGGEELVVSLSD